MCVQKKAIYKVTKIVIFKSFINPEYFKFEKKTLFFLLINSEFYERENEAIKKSTIFKRIFLKLRDD